MRVTGKPLMFIAVLGTFASWSQGSTAAGQEATPIASPAAIDACGPATTTSAKTPVADADIDPTALDLDVLYIDILIPHHEAVVRMAIIGQGHSARPEVVSLAAHLAEVQTAEVAELRAWRKAWYADVPALSQAQLFARLETKAASPGAAGAPGLAELSSFGTAEGVSGLCEVTDDFDLAFIEAMVGQLTGSVLLSQLVATEAVHPELAAFAKTVIQKEASEMKTLLGWRDAWYGG